MIYNSKKKEFNQELSVSYWSQSILALLVLTVSSTVDSYGFFKPCFSGSISLSIISPLTSFKL